MYRVLLVDDERMALVSVRHSFDWEAFHIHDVLETVNPYRALELLEGGRFDAAFLDIRMPELSGFDIIRRCREKGLSTAFVILTGYSDFEYAKQALKLGAFDYCLKPLQPEEIAGLLPRLCPRLLGTRRQEDPELLHALQRGGAEGAEERLRRLGLRTERPWLGVAWLASPGAAELELPLPGERAVLMAEKAAAVWFFTCDEDPADRLKAACSALPAPCGAAGCAYCVGREESGLLPTLLKRARLEAEKALDASRGSGRAEAAFFDPRDCRDWNDSFLRLMEEVDARYNEELSLTELARRYAMNYSYCSTLFGQRTGTTFSKYVTALRMRRAKELLETTELSVGEICGQVGYSDYHYFANIFKRIYRMTPTQCREAAGEG